MLQKIFENLSYHFFPIATYEITLADYEPILPELAQIINADYVPGSYDISEGKFHQNGESSSEWSLTGELGELIIYFEKYEGYDNAAFQAPNPQFQMGKDLL
jgi:hypothetical protein